MAAPSIRCGTNIVRVHLTEQDVLAMPARVVVLKIKEVLVPITNNKRMLGKAMGALKKSLVLPALQPLTLQKCMQAVEDALKAHAVGWKDIIHQSFMVAARPKLAKMLSHLQDCKLTRPSA